MPGIFCSRPSEKFDAITSDPLDPWVKGAAMLYTTEFFELVKRHLNPGGVVTLFVQLYESNTEAVKSEIGTFFKVFPHGMVFGNTYNGMGYDLVLLGQVEPTRIDLDEMERRLKRPEYAPVAKSLAAIGMSSAVDLFATFAGQAPDFAAVAGRRRDQSRSQPAAPVSGGPWTESLSRRSDLRRDAPTQQRPRRHLHRVRRARAGAPPENPVSVGAVTHESLEV